MMEILDRKYRLVGKVSEGGTSSVYRAEEIGKDAVFAIKILHRASRRVEQIIRFHQEIDFLTGIHNPHIIKIHERGVCDDGAGLHEAVHYLVMDYIEGCNLGELIESRFPDIRQWLVIMEQVSRALSELHRHGIVHGDLKPENIMISRDKEKLHATLIDFSLTKIKHDRRQNDAAGTLFYMSPEKTGMIKRPVDERSDLYALGVIGYRMLTRSFPFQGESLTDLLHSQVAVNPERPSKLNPSVPGILDHILMKLLEKDPSRRYQSADGLIPDLEKVRRGILDFIPGQADRLPDPDYLPQITGRDKELDHLYGAVDGLEKSGRVCLLAGQAGVGKTKILEALGQYARKKSCLVLEGRCVQRKNQTPWSLFQEILSDYMKIFSQYPDVQKAAVSRAVKKESGDLGSIIIRMFPPAGILLGRCPELLALDLEKDKLRSFHAVIRFFLALIRAEKKMVMVLEDLQWIDSLSYSILSDLVGVLKDYGVMIIGSYRANEVNRWHPLSELIDTVAGMKNAEAMTIEPLTQQQTGALVKAIVKGKPAQFDRLCDFIFEKSRGNPLYILEVVKNLFYRKVLLRQGKSFIFDEKGLAQIQIPQNLQDIILQRINRLDETDIGILCDASVLGKRFATGILIELEKIKGRSRQSVVSCLDKAHAYWILEKDTGLDKRNFSFTHDRIRDAFYKKIEGEKKTIHNSIGRLIESTYHHSNKKSDQLFDLAHHFINAENEEKILEYVYPAGLYAMDRYDYDLAVRYLTIIKTILENHLGSRQDPETRVYWRQCSAKLGEAMIMTGANETGAALLISLVPFCGNPMEKATLYFQTCSAYATRGDWRHCEEHGKAGLALLGISLPIEKNEVKCQIARDLTRYFVQAFLPGILLRQRASGKVARTRLIIMFYQIIAWAMILGDKYKFLHASLRLVWLSEKKTSDLETRCISYGLFVTFCVKNGFWRAAEYYMRKAFALSEKSSHDVSMAQILMIKGFFYQFRADYLKSVEFFTKSVGMYDRIGDMGSSLHCRIGLIDTYVLQGDHERIEQLLAPYSHMAHKFSDTNGMASVLFKQAGLAYEKGNLKEAEKKALECLDFSSAHNSLNNVSWIHALLGAIYLEKNNPDQALAHLCRGMDMYREKTVFGEYSVWSFPLYAETLISKRLANHAIALKQIKKACKTALAKTRIWKNYHGPSLRVYAKYLHLAKQNRRANKMFQKSIRLLERLGRKFELALSRREYGYFLRENGHYEAAFSQLNQAWAIFNGMGSAFRNRIVNYPGPADPAGKTVQRMIDARKKDMEFHPAGKLVSFGDMQTLTRYILDASMKITGAEGGCLFLLDKKTGLLKLASKNHVAGHAYLDYSQGIVDQVFESGVSVVSVDASNDIRLNPYRSVSLKRLKSVICMPLLYEDRVSGTCYLFNQLASGVFSTDEEMQLKEFLSAASVHLENVRLKQSLEKRKETAPDNGRPIVDGKLDSVIDFIHCRFTDNISREIISKALNLDPIILGKEFKATMGKSLKEYVNELRLGHAYKLLLETDKKIIDIAYESGFESLRTFNRVFSNAMGDTPSNYRKHYRSNRKRTRPETPQQNC